MRCGRHAQAAQAYLCIGWVQVGGGQRCVVRCIFCWVVERLEPHFRCAPDLEAGYESAETPH